METIRITTNSTLEVEQKENGEVLVRIRPDNPLSFLCPETGEVEEKPILGDLAILWGSHKRRGEAIISYVEETDVAEGYLSNNTFWYRNAIRFRSEAQYRKIVNGCRP